MQVEFVQSISTSEARGAVEKWLLQVQDGMLASVRDVVKRSREVCSHIDDALTVLLFCGLLECTLLLNYVNCDYNYCKQDSGFHIGCLYIFINLA